MRRAASSRLASERHAPADRTRHTWKTCSSKTRCVNPATTTFAAQHRPRHAVTHPRRHERNMKNVFCGDVAKTELRSKCRKIHSKCSAHSLNVHRDAPPCPRQQVAAVHVCMARADCAWQHAVRQQHAARQHMYTVMKMQVCRCLAYLLLRHPRPHQRTRHVL